jgi:hypothetical protein
MLGLVTWSIQLGQSSVMIHVDRPSTFVGELLHFRCGRARGAVCGGMPHMAAIVASLSVYLPLNSN